ncbi:MAG TPA: hypothetical protein VMZ31_05815 [Phycisphaerae bacterium]|nr:hypothetical protein [Phycisphaerae bacterium]
MCTSRTFLGSALAFCCMLGHAPLATAQQPTAKEPPKAPEGWILVEEDVLFVFVDEPEHHFQKARESFLKKDSEATVASLHKAAGFLRLEAARADSDSHRTIMASVHELEKLAADVRSGAAVDVKRFDSVFARAHHALAQHHQAKSRAHLAKKEHKKAGHHLKAAASHLEHGAAWAGHEIEAGSRATINAARTVAGKLVEGTGWAEDEVGTAVGGMGKEIEKLGKWIEPAKKP